MKAALTARVLLASVAVSTGAAAASPTAAVISESDLSKPFATHSAWRFTATQGPPVDDPTIPDNGKIPGAIDLCLRRGTSGPCDPQLQRLLHADWVVPLYAEPHLLELAEVVHPRGAGEPPVFLVRAASVQSVDGGRVVATAAFAYRPGADRFEAAYVHLTGTNNNQETRYIAAGPLRGDIISAEPTDNAPYGFWVTVNRLTPAYSYRQVLRYRSATRYNDGNTLAVIDSEMPNIEQRLGVWRSGAALPMPAGPCPKPHLVRTELWCH
jgi:hypothetical protein